jgi:hypothetical protein
MQAPPPVVPATSKGAPRGSPDRVEDCGGPSMVGRLSLKHAAPGKPDTVSRRVQTPPAAMCMVNEGVERRDPNQGHRLTSSEGRTIGRQLDDCSVSGQGADAQ